MSFSRREFLKLNGIIGFFLLTPFLKIAKGDTLDMTNELASLRTYIEILIPMDELPSALQLGADARILEKCEQDFEYAKAIKKGVYWLNFIAQKWNKTDFSSLSNPLQLKVVVLSEKSLMATLPNLFYLMIRQDVFQYYYAHPEIIKQFHYARPPQPHGFTDFTQAPLS